MRTSPILYAVKYLLRRLRGDDRAPGPLNQPSRLGLEALLIARDELGKGESGMNNCGTDVAKYTRGLQGHPWCAWFVTWCLAEAAKRNHVELPIAITGGAKKLYRRVGQQGFFVPPDMVQPGDLVCWHRGAANAATGHVGIVSRTMWPHFWAIEGNRGAFPAKVAEFSHSFDEGGLLGFARLGG